MREPTQMILEDPGKRYDNPLNLRFRNFDEEHKGEGENVQFLDRMPSLILWLDEQGKSG
jgi:hypothetical protein